MKAYRIVNWWKFELLKNGKLATAKTKPAALRIKPLIYVRFPIHGHALSADYRRIVKRAGPDMAAACDGVYKMLVGLAGNQVREYRGWVLDDRQQPLNPEQVAELLCLSKEKISRIFEILTDDVVKWVNLEEFPEALHKSLNGSDLSGGSQIKNFGNNWEKKGTVFKTKPKPKDKDKENGFVTETEGGGVREKSGEGESREAGSAEGGKENLEPHALPASPASVSVPDTVSVPASVSEQLSDSDSDSVTDTDSVSKPGMRAGHGAGCSERLSQDEIFEIRRECKLAALELTQIIHPHNKSDITTIQDIYTQLQNRMIAGSPHKLFELSLNTARQCWRGDKPIAVFVTAMKKPPFYYVPKRLSVIPGKFSQDRNIH